MHPAGVFVSYRREGTNHVAGRLYDHLAMRFGRGNIFIDIASIPAGVDFEEALQHALDKCGVLLAVIGRISHPLLRQRRRRSVEVRSRC